MRSPSINHDGPVFYTVEGENNFSIGGRLMTGTLPGKVTPVRGSYKADALGNLTVLDVFANASPTTQARLPAQPKLAPVMPVLSERKNTVGADGLPAPTASLKWASAT